MNIFVTLLPIRITDLSDVSRICRIDGLGALAGNGQRAVGSCLN